MRGGPESSQRTVPPELSCRGESDMHNNALVPSTRVHIYYKRIRARITIRTRVIIKFLSGQLVISCDPPLIAQMIIILYI